METLFADACLATDILNGGVGLFSLTKNTDFLLCGVSFAFHNLLTF
ncbi:hypothetical protein [Cerasicoccus arenae]|nr:hypothetical protein [Cerasicoccus arenae]MBK1858353.1 hypothetical protein [Cerasicoccus arenae]